MMRVADLEEKKAEEMRGEISETQMCFLSVSWLIIYHCLAGDNGDDQEGKMLVYNHEAKSAHVSQMMAVRRGKQAGSGGPESRQGAGRVLH